MKRRTRLWLRVAAVFVTLLAIAGGALWLRLQPDHMGRVVPLFESIDMSALPKFADGVRSATSVQVFQNAWEKEKDTFKSHGHYFYNRAITPTAEDADALRGLALDESGFEEWRGVRFCGGYHPDWLIRWTSPDGEDHELHLCLSCHEAKLYGPDYQLYCDVRKTAYNAFKIILTRYSSKRP